MPVPKRKFSDMEMWAQERCEQWNGCCDIAQIALDLLENGPDFGTVQWNEVGGMFTKYFSGAERGLCDTAKRDWETIGNIAYRFGPYFDEHRKKLRASYMEPPSEQS